MMKNLLLFFSHILNLILVAFIALGLGAILGCVDPDDCISEGFNSIAQSINKKKENKEDKVIKMGFHLED